MAGAAGQQEPLWLGMGSEQTQRHLGGIGMTILLRAVEQMRERLPGAVGLVPSSVCWWHMESPLQGHWGCLAVSWDWLRTWLRRAEHCPVGWGSPEAPGEEKLSQLGWDPAWAGSAQGALGLGERAQAVERQPVDVLNWFSLILALRSPICFAWLCLCFQSFFFFFFGTASPAHR